MLHKGDKIWLDTKNIDWNKCWKCIPWLNLLHPSALLSVIIGLSVFDEMKWQNEIAEL